MATRYWVGGSGNWDATSTANWSTSSGGASGASAPTSTDDVIFDAGSNVGTDPFTVTVTGTSAAPALCQDFSTGGAGGALDGAMTLAFGTTGYIDSYGSVTFPATNFSITSGASTTAFRFRATTTGKTFTTNGVSLGSAQAIFAGVGGAWTLGSALTSTTAVDVLNGTFNSGNYNISVNQFTSTGTGTRTVNLGSSTVTLTSSIPITLSGSNLTFNADTSQITCSAAAPTFNGGGYTFYNVSFTSSATGTVNITGVNTFNNLTFTSLAATGLKNIQITVNQTINGTLTFGTANTAIRRMAIFTGTTPGPAITITLNGTLATLADVDFRGIGTAGTAGTWTGTRLGNGGNNSGITFDAGVDKYWNLAAGGNWSATAWALSSGGAVAANNFPLAQDNVIIENTGLNTGATITIDQSWWWGNVNTSTRSNAYTLAWGGSDPIIYGNFTLSSATTITSATSPSLNFYNYNSTKTITTAGVAFPVLLQIYSYLGTVQLLDNMNNTWSGGVTLNIGTLDLNNNTLTCVAFTSSNSNTRAIAFGTGKIVVTGNNATVFSMATATNFTYTGTPTVEFNYSGSTGTRQLNFGNTAGATESNVVSFNVIAGTDQVSGTTSVKNYILTGFAGTFANSTRTIYGNLVIPSGVTISSGTAVTTFAATSGTQQVTTNGVTLDFPITQNSPGATVQLQDNLTMGSTRTLTLTAGTLDLNTNTLTTGLYSSTGSIARELKLGTGTLTVSGATFTASGSNYTTTGTGTISMTSASGKTFAGGGFTYPILNQGGSGALVITGANTFANITNTVQPATVTFPASTTTTVSNFSLLGTVGNLITLNSSTAGTRANLSDASGIVSRDYLSIQDINATGGASWYAGNNSTNVSNNSGWIFTAVPIVSKGNFFFMMGM